MKKEMFIREYARYRNCSRGAVEKAIKSGRITRLANGKIDPIQADKDWERNTLETKSSIEQEREDKFGISYKKVKTAETVVRTQLMQLELQKQKEEFIPVDDLLAFIDSLFNGLKKMIPSFSKRVSSMVQEERDVIKISEIITEELKKEVEDYNKTLDDI